MSTCVLCGLWRPLYLFMYLPYISSVVLHHFVKSQSIDMLVCSFVFCLLLSDGSLANSYLSNPTVTALGIIIRGLVSKAFIAGGIPFLSLVKY